MIRRSIENAIKDGMRYYPIIAITGPRQSGKTTLLKSIFPDFEYLSFENPDLRKFAETDPNGFLQRYPDKTIFDEVQWVPSLFSYIQTKIDSSGLMGQYVFSGSQNFSLMKNITQSLAGRVSLFKLLPFDNAELKSVDLLPKEYADHIVRGCYPALYDRKIPSTTFYANYIETYIQRDLTELLQVKDLQTFKTFLKLCAARVGQQLNISHLANDAGVSASTAKSWLSILETSYVLFLLPPFFKNFNKRLVKTPKLYFFDTGLASFLLGIRNGNKLLDSDFKGALFENMVINEYMKQNYNYNLHSDMYYWRDSNGNEVDLVLSRETVYDIVEMKASKTILPKSFYGLEFLGKIGDKDIENKTLVYGGEENQNRTEFKVRSWRNV